MYKVLYEKNNVGLFCVIVILFHNIAVFFYAIVVFFLCNHTINVDKKLHEFDNIINDDMTCHFVKLRAFKLYNYIIKFELVLVAPNVLSQFAIRINYPVTTPATKH